MKYYKIYCYTNLINNKKYIGQTCHSLKERAGVEGIKYKNPKLADDDPNQYNFWKAIKKYGWNNFVPSILEDNLTLEEANSREQYWIAYYHTWVEDPLCWGYNLESGGKNCQMSQETKDKISNSMKRENNPFYGKHHSEESKQKISEKNKGRKWSEEQKRKMSEQRKGHIVTDETRKKISIANTGKHHTEETKQKIRESHLGKHHSEESKQKMSQQRKGVPKTQQHKDKIGKANSKPVRCIETGIIYNSCTEATHAVGLKNPISISAVCRGKGKTAAGYHWEYIEKEK